MGNDMTMDDFDPMKGYLAMASAFAEPELAAARASANPQPMYVELINTRPVREIGPGMVSVLRMDDILFINKHHDVEQGSKFLGSSRPAIPLGLDGAEHRKYRRLLDPVFTAKKVAPLEESVRRLAHELIDGFIDKGEVDAYHDWCEPLPSSIFLNIMGLPLEDLEAFTHFKNLTLGNDSDEYTYEEKDARRLEAVEWIHNYFNASLDEREKEPEARPDMIGMLQTAEVDGERLSREDTLDILGLLMIAGLDTVAASLACFVSHFARHPDDRARIVADPSLIPSAVEELMRFESPVTDGNRIARADLELPSGAKIAKGTYMHICWASAAVDPNAFNDPLTIDFNRSPNPHIGFASGFHRCLGSHLARMEMRVALEVWHERIPNYSVKPGVELHYTGNPRAPHVLPLVW
ncbi:MAG: cytochrome P450 [Acidimicrobiia bacterium]